MLNPIGEISVDETAAAFRCTWDTKLPKYQKQLKMFHFQIWIRCYKKLFASSLNVLNYIVVYSIDPDVSDAGYSLKIPPTTSLISSVLSTFLSFTI